MTLSKPAVQVIDLGGVNQWLGQGWPKKLAIVCHIAAGSYEGAISWFKNPQAQASSNFCVAKNGRIAQFVDPESSNAPYANGLINQPDAAVQQLLVQANHANPNYWTVSIEYEGQPGDALTDVQFGASTTLAAWLCERFAIPADDNHLLGHYEFDNVTRHNCPGWNTDTWNRWETAVQTLLGPSDPCSELRAQLLAIGAERDRLARQIADARAALAG